MTEKETAIGQQEEGISESRKQEIAGYFIQHAGSLTDGYLNDLKLLGVREVFDLLVSKKLEYFGFAISIMREFPNPETVKLLTELRKIPPYSRDKGTIDWILFQFTHHPECSEQAISVLKELDDPRVILENDKGRIELSTQSAISKVVPLIPAPDSREQALEKQREWLLKCFKEGAVFTLWSKDNDLVCVAIAHQMSDYILYLDYIHTLEGKRRLGYAESMLEYLLKHHVVLQCDLFRGSMLSEKVLEKLGFKHECPGDKWIYKVKRRGEPNR